ncbi:hypothetical protein [Micromonospora aurantiaca]|uniref:Uncharacterized protein n=1 Tax=Micromonospora aurantiaca (nom. illeg.) TaxID=47850 RepID=A0A6N3JTB3_9ACTN|nr:hypothetical protein [Micromonospora aurantiaca]AXH88821.1 hypothetical protein DVH21_02130 [Micromonospora aurantiaca]
MERAMIWVPPNVEALAPSALCMNHVLHRGYRFEGIVHAPWEAVERMMVDGEVEVVVIADPAHLPADRTPRIEVADGRPIWSALPPRGGGPQPPRRRRPHTLE